MRLPRPCNYRWPQLGTSHLHSVFAAMRGQLRDKAVCSQRSTARSSAVGHVSRNRVAGRDSSSHVCVCADNPRRPCRAVIPLFARQPAHCAPGAGLNSPMRSSRATRAGALRFANAGAVPQCATRGWLACGSHCILWVPTTESRFSGPARYAQPLTAFRKKSSRKQKFAPEESLRGNFARH